eukprot:scaffold23810_cov131-Isochrysis_galbana.AAC.4
MGRRAGLPYIIHNTSHNRCAPRRRRAHAYKPLTPSRRPRRAAHSPAARPFRNSPIRTDAPSATATAVVAHAADVQLHGHAPREAIHRRSLTPPHLRIANSDDTIADRRGTLIGV